MKPKRDKDYKGKKPFVPKKEGRDDGAKSAEDSKSFRKKAERPDRKDQNNDKDGFKRYKDESRPSDFGTAKKNSGGNSSFKRKSDSDKPPFKKKFGEKKPFNRKSYSDKPDYASKSKKEANPFDLDESDLEYGKPKKEFKREDRGNERGRGYIKKPYIKKTNSGKGVAKPQRETDDGLIRLNKYIANAGISSRREADDLIASGVVQVNGKVITEMGFRIKPTDIIKFGGQTLKKERLVYLILNKPKDYITTLDDDQKRRTVMELVGNACKERIYPVGRLDRNTTGLLMFTNDGELTKKLTHPKYGVKKIYHVELDKPLKAGDLKQIEDGIELEDGPIKVDEVSYVGNGEDKTQVGVEIHSGKNRIVRRIFEHFGYNVRKLDRVVFGPLTKKDMPRGRWRFLTDAELGMLQMISQK
jgi:23S rRNA pseudouridine2605 synthase